METPGEILESKEQIPTPEIKDSRVLIEANFETLEKLHFFSEANLFSRLAPYMGATSSWLREHGVRGQKGLASLDDTSYREYLTEFSIKPEFQGRIINYSRIQDEKLLDFLFSQLGRSRLEQLTTDLSQVSIKDIVNTLDESISHFRKEISGCAPCLPRDDNEIGPFFTILSAGLTGASVLEGCPPNERKRIILYYLLKKTGGVDSYRDPILENMSSKEKIDETIEHIKQLDRLLLDTKWSPENKVIVHHFIRSGYMDLLNTLQSLKVIDGILCENYRPVFEETQQSFTF